MAGLEIAKEKLFNDVNQDSTKYHWCFYFSMMLLDGKLKSDGLGIELKARLKAFHLEMKGLLVLASCLDQATQTNTYMKYARKRYIDISRTHFARPLSTLPGKEPRKKKPAAEFEQK